MVSKVLTHRPAFEDTLMCWCRRSGTSTAFAPTSKSGHLAAGNGQSRRRADPAAGKEPTKMPEVLVGKIADIAEGDRRIVTHGELEIGVFHWQGHFYAYENLCLHQGGPCCEGVIMHKVEDVLGPDKT
jgi:hypothetical protein